MKDIAYTELDAGRAERGSVENRHPESVEPHGRRESQFSNRLFSERNPCVHVNA